MISDDIQYLSKQYDIDGVLYVPHSIPRKRQFLPALRQSLRLPLFEIRADKVFSNGIPVAQKSLAKIDERLDNAARTIFLRPPHQTLRHILIIDDAIGSGGTVNEVARKLKHLSGSTTCHAYAVVGSYKGFDVISTV